MPNFPDYPFAQHSLTINGLRMNYVDEGPRDGGAGPILMVHGNPTWSYYYRRLIAAFSPTHRVIAPDHIGMGLSDKPTDAQYPFTLARRVDDLDALMSSFNLSQPITLVVHDWGGMIGMAWAARHPEKIARLVILNTGAFRLPAAKPMPWQLKLSRTPGLGALLVRGLNLFAQGATRQCVMRPMQKSHARALVSPYNSWHNRRAVHRFIQDIPLAPGQKDYALVAATEAALEKFRHTPILICWGMHDFVFDHHFLTRWLEFFPTAPVHRFEDAGHYVLEDAHERIIPLMRQFLGTTLTPV